jgi:hypothetical protein
MTRSQKYVRCTTETKSSGARGKVSQPHNHLQVAEIQGCANTLRPKVMARLAIEPGFPAYMAVAQNL